MDETVRLWVFASENIRNIQMGFEAGKWAVTEIDEKSMKARYTKSRWMEIGEHGLIYCSEDRNFTMPFAILSKPEFTIISGVWPEPWASPFNIKPLGSPNRTLSLDSAKQSWKYFRHEERANPTWRLNGMNGKTVFSPNDIPEGDWKSILRDLGFPQQ